MTVMNPPIAQYAGPAGHFTFAPALNATSGREHNFSGAYARNKLTQCEWPGS
jgi:hypothetical protein